MKHIIISGEELFDLVRSLTKAEKRNFKILTTKVKGEKFYIRLFDIFNSQKEYDERTVLSKIKKEKSKKNYSSAKKYLFEKIIASLHSLGTYKYEDTKVKDLIETATLLRSKGLYNQAQRYLEYARAEAIQSDTIFNHFAINFWSYAFSLNSTDSKLPIEEKTKLLNEEGRDLLLKAEEYLKVYHIFRSIRAVQVSNPHVRSKKEQDKLSKMIAPLVGMDYRKFSGVSSKIHYHIAMFTYHSMSGKHMDALSHCRKLIELVKANPKIDNSVYPQLSNYITEAIKAKHLEGIEGYLAEFLGGIRKFPDFHEQKLIFERWLLYSIKYLNAKGDFERVFALMEKEKKLVDKYSPRTNYINLQILYQISAAHFFAGNYAEAWKYINKILNDENSNTDIFVYAKIFSLFILYKKKDFDLLQHSFRSAYRLLMKKERLYKSEKNILDFIRNSQKSFSKKNTEANLKILAQQLERSFEDPFEQAIQYYFDILRWLKMEKII